MLLRSVFSLEIFKKTCRTAAAARGEPTAKFQKIRQEKLRNAAENTKISEKQGLLKMLEEKPSRR